MQEHLDKIKNILNNEDVATNNSKNIIVAFDYLKSILNDSQNLGIDRTQLTSSFMENFVPVFESLSEENKNNISHALINNFIKLDPENYRNNEAFLDIGEYLEEPYDEYLKEQFLKRELQNGNINVHHMAMRTYDERFDKELGFSEIEINQPGDTVFRSGSNVLPNFTNINNMNIEQLLSVYKSSEKTLNKYLLPNFRRNSQYPIIDDENLNEIIDIRNQLNEERPTNIAENKDVIDFDNYLISQYLIDQYYVNNPLTDSNDLVLPLNKDETYDNYDLVLDDDTRQASLDRMKKIENIYGKDLLYQKIAYSNKDKMESFNPETTLLNRYFNDIKNSPNLESSFLADSIRVVDLMEENTGEIENELYSVRTKLKDNLNENLPENTKAVGSEIAKVYFHENINNPYISEKSSNLSYEEKYAIDIDYQKEAQKEWDKFCEMKGLQPVNLSFGRGVEMTVVDPDTEMKKAKYFKLSRDGSMRIPKERFNDENGEIFKMAALNAKRNGWATVALTPPSSGTYQECEAFLKNSMLALFEEGYEPEQLKHPKSQKFGKSKANWEKMKWNLWEQFNGLEASVDNVLSKEQELAFQKMEQEAESLDDISEENEKIPDIENPTEQFSTEPTNVESEESEPQSLNEEENIESSNYDHSTEPSMPENDSDFFPNNQDVPFENNSNNIDYSDIEPPQFNYQYLDFPDCDLTPINELYPTFMENASQLSVNDLKNNPELNVIFAIQKVREALVYQDLYNATHPDHDMPLEPEVEKVIVDKLNNALSDEQVDNKKVRKMLQDIPDKERKKYIDIITEYGQEHAHKYVRINKQKKNIQPGM